MAFWTHTLHRDPGILRRLYFESVLESQTTEVLQQQICPRLGKRWTEGVHAAPWETLNVYRPYGTTYGGGVDATEDELDMWGMLVGEMGSGSQLVKIAQHMCAAYPRGDEYTGVVQVERIVFRPKMDHLMRPVGYDLEIRMGLEDSLAHRSVSLATSDHRRH